MNFKPKAIYSVLILFVLLLGVLISRENVLIGRIIMIASLVLAIINMILLIKTGKFKKG